MESLAASAQQSRPAAVLSPSSSPAYVVPVRGHFDSIARLMTGDQYIGRGCRQRELEKSPFCNPNKGVEYSRVNAIRLHEQFLDSNAEVVRQVPSLSGKSLVCHCTPMQSCHADPLIRKFRELCLGAYDRDDPTQRAPTGDELNLLARHRQGSSADEGVSAKNSGWVGARPPLQVGVGYTSRDCCDGQGLASPGRWPVENRQYPSSSVWERVTRRFTKFAETWCTTQLLMELAVGKVESCPFEGL